MIEERNWPWWCWYLKHLVGAKIYAHCIVGIILQLSHRVSIIHYLYIKLKRNISNIPKIL